jgi:hypothetical protein
MAIYATFDLSGRGKLRSEGKDKKKNGTSAQTFRLSFPDMFT